MIIHKKKLLFGNLTLRLEKWLVTRQKVPKHYQKPPKSTFQLSKISDICIFVCNVLCFDYLQKCNHAADTHVLHHILWLDSIIYLQTNIKDCTFSATFWNVWFSCHKSLTLTGFYGGLTILWGYFCNNSVMMTDGLSYNLILKMGNMNYNMTQLLMHEGDASKFT